MNFLRAIAAGTHQNFGDREIREGYVLGSSSNIARLKNTIIPSDIIKFVGGDCQISLYSSLGRKQGQDF